MRTSSYYGGYSGYPISGATTNTLRLGPGDADYPNASNSIKADLSLPFEPGGSGIHNMSYSCAITAYDYDSTDHYSENLGIEPVYVRVEGSFSEKLYSLFVDPLKSAILGMIVAPANLFGLMGTFGLVLLPIALPFYVLYFMIREFAANFSGLFLF